jgi:lactate dehydrogenase-like 2-hydroxyacid dehydrogenase
LHDLGEFWGSADFFVVSVPSNPETAYVNGVIVCGGRTSGHSERRARTDDERARYAALKDRRIGGAIIDTWCSYPRPPSRTPALETPVPRVAEHRDDATHVRLDNRNHQSAQADYCGQHQASRRWQTMRQRSETSTNVSRQLGIRLA